MTNLSISFNNSAYIWQIERIVKNSDNIERTGIYLFLDVLFPTLRLRSKKLCYYSFLGANADEQNLSKKVAVICQDEKPSPSEKRLHKGTLES